MQSLTINHLTIITIPDVVHLDDLADDLLMDYMIEAGMEPRGAYVDMGHNHIAIRKADVVLWNKLFTIITNCNS
jgi:hypothetical protein